MKKLLALLLVAVMLISLAACGEKKPAPGTDTTITEPVSDDGNTTPEQTTTDEGGNTPAPGNRYIFTNEDKVIDLYFIAGQSNAVGYTKFTDTAAAYEFAPELENGFSNVLIAGKVRFDKGSSYESRRFIWQPVKLGFGAYDANYSGPETGMAKALSQEYNAESGKTAGIIKFGHGGTSLLNKTTGSNQYGNWVSPSYARSIGAAYTGATGGLYRGFLEEIESQLKALAESGYTNVNVKGLYWMQGESDRADSATYADAFKAFVKDLRNDLSEMLMEMTGADDRGASAMPIFVGTISKTFNLTSADMQTVNQTFIATQNGLPGKITDCYVIDNSGFAISQWNAGENKTEVLGYDQWHWKQADVLTIGENVGKAMLRQQGVSVPDPVDPQAKPGLTAKESGEAMVWDLLG